MNAAPLPVGPLSLRDLLPNGPLRRIGRRVALVDSVSSTNMYLLEQAAVAGDGALACAEHQSAGRGRLGRRWEAPRGSSILLSVLLHEAADSPLLSVAALLGAVAAREAIAAVTDCRPEVRWPNDLVIGGRKLGGVLAESGTLTGGRRALVIGIGINCLQQKGHFAGELARTATSLELESRAPVERPRVAAALLERLDAWFGVLSGLDGATQLRNAWRRHCGDVGQRVRLRHDNRLLTGTAIDIEPNGDLLVQLDEGGRRAFAAATTTREW